MNSTPAKTSKRNEIEKEISLVLVNCMRKQNHILAVWCEVLIHGGQLCVFVCMVLFSIFNFKGMPNTISLKIKHNFLYAKKKK